MPDPNGQVTRAEFHEALDSLEARLNERLDRFTQFIANELEKLATKEYVHQVETNLLTAFHGYSTNQSVRMSKVQTDIASLTLEAQTRLNNLDQRVTGIEKKLGLPPHGGLFAGGNGGAKPPETPPSPDK